MGQLVVVAYDDQHKAEEMRLKLLKMQRDYLIDLEDAVVAIKKPDGKIKLNQAISLPVLGGVEGSFWGLLIGLLFLNPVFGVVLGAGSGAIAGALSDVGINDQFMKDLAANLKPNSSALFVLVKHITPDKVMEELQGTGGKLLKTSLTHEDEAKLQAVLSQAAPVGAAK